MRDLYAVALAMCTMACACLKPAFAEEQLSNSEFEERYSAPAVSGINGKISIGYIGLNLESLNTGVFRTPFTDSSQEGAFVEGSVSVPIGERFGFQLDAAYGSLGGDTNIDYHGIGGHLFWRDPQQALLGLYAHYTEYGGTINNIQIAAEAELYFENISFELLAGIDVVDTGADTDEYFAGEAILAYYFNDNFRLSAGVRHALDTTSFVVGAEAMMPVNGFAPSFFVEASIDEDDATSVSGGVRVYLGGGQKSLIRRHREDDPKVRLQANSDVFGRCLGKSNTGIASSNGCRGTLSQPSSGGSASDDASNSSGEQASGGSESGANNNADAGNNGNEGAGNGEAGNAGADNGAAGNAGAGNGGADNGGAGNGAAGNGGAGNGGAGNGANNQVFEEPPGLPDVIPF